MISRLLTVLHSILLRNRYKSRVFYKSNIYNRIPGGVCVGDRCTIGRTRKGYHAGMPFYTTLLNDGNNSHIKIGNNCRINGAYIHAQDFIEIGDNCVMASGVNIIDSNAHQLHSSDRTAGRDNPKGIIIGNNVWIGLNAVVLKGTVIGNNCVGAAGSITKGTFPDNTIIQGNPAVPVGNVNIE